MKWLLILLFISTIITANEPKERPKIPLEISLPHLKGIESSALIMGNGPIKAYVFIDPNCPNSQNFVSLIHENDKMRSRYTYFFFLYELKRFNSSTVISQIYSSSNPLEAMKHYMIEHQTLSQKVNLTVLGKIAEIAKVAETLDVYKRPYIIMVKREK